MIAASTTPRFDDLVGELKRRGGWKGAQEVTFVFANRNDALQVLRDFCDHHLTHPPDAKYNNFTCEISRYSSSGDLFKATLRWTNPSYFQLPWWRRTLSSLRYLIWR